jgi:hypothetical protein
MYAVGLLLSAKLLRNVLGRTVDAWRTYAEPRGLSRGTGPVTDGEFAFEGAFDGVVVQIRVSGGDRGLTRVRAVGGPEGSTICVRKRCYAPGHAQLERGNLRCCETGDATFDSVFEVACEGSEPVKLVLETPIRESLLVCGALWFERENGGTEVILSGTELDTARLDAALDVVMRMTGCHRQRAPYR